MKMKTYNFYDTSSLLVRGEHLFDDPNENIIISSITLNELENIKTSNRDPETKAGARRLLRVLDANPDAYDVWVYMSTMLEDHVPDMSCWEINNDIKILASAVTYDKTIHPDETVFITEDLSLKQIANHYFGSDSIRKATPPPPDIYDGYKEITMTETEMANFYENSSNNIYNLNINEYIIVKNEYDEIVDTLCWTGEEHRPLKYGSFDSRHLGKVKPMKNDIYQAILADSFLNNTITLVKGPAGTGKSYMSLAFLFSQLDAGKIDKIIVFCNTVATKNSAKLGYYPGSREEKLLDSQIGNFLSSKLGSRYEAEHLMQQDLLVLLPLSDLRGYDTSGMRAGIYITEAQNMDIGLMKLALQRIGEDSICILDGDYQTQLDLDAFAGDNNGMKRVSKVFRNHDIYGEVTLRNIHRSKLAMIAESM